MKIMNKDTILTCLWTSYTILAVFLGFQIKESGDVIEVIFCSILVSQLILGTWLMISLFSNIPYKGIIDLPKRKRFKSKVNPIYKLITYKEDKEWYVEKFELKWDNEHNFSFLLFVPFARLFNAYKYVSVGTYEFDYDLEGVTNIGLFWEERFSADKEKERKENEELAKHWNKVDELNKTFNENYE